MKANLTEIIFPTSGGERAISHGAPIPEGATLTGWDVETLTLTYETTDEEGVVATDSVTWTQGEIDAFEAASAQPTPQDIASLSETLWRAYNAHAESEMDQNARVTVVGLPAKQGATAQQLTRAAEVMAWWEAHWTDYGVKKAELLQTGTMPSYTFTSCPWSIWDLA